MAVKAYRAPSNKSGSSPALAAGKGPATAPCQPSPEDLLRDLVGLSKITLRENGCSEANDQEEILFDVDLDGARYLLIRKPKPNRARVQLSPREQEIVRMVAQGHPNKVIADVLNISSWTVCTHMRRIFAKLGVASRAAMVARMFAANETREGNERSLQLVFTSTTATVPSAAGASTKSANQGMGRALEPVRRPSKLAR